MKVKDISFEGDYEDVTSIQYEIFNKGEKPVRISEVKCNKGRRCVIGEPINIKVKSSGGIKPLYKFVVYKDGIQKEAIEYGLNNWVDFIPTEAGKYEIDIRVKDEFSSRKCDASTSLVIEAIAKAENVEVSEEEVNSEVQKMADAYKMTVEQVKEALRPNDLKDMEGQLKIRKTIDLLVENAKIA